MPRSSLFVAGAVRRFLAVFVSVALVWSSAPAAEFTVFEKTYVRQTGQPEEHTDHFTVLNPTAPWTARIVNGDPRATKGEVKLNRRYEWDIHRHTTVISQPVQLRRHRRNRVKAEIKGQPGGRYTFRVTGVDTMAPVATWLSPVAGFSTSSPTVTASVRFTDDVSGIDPATIEIQLDGASVRPLFPAVSSPTLSVTLSASLAVAVGPHTLTARATDKAGLVSATASVSFTRSATAVNQPPVVNAGAAQTVTLPDTASLNGSATDDGLPNPPAALTYQWSLDSGPASVTVENATAPATTAAFTAPGVYVFRLTASDSQLSASNTTVVTVAAANTAPTVDAGAAQTVTLPGTASLNGSATDDNLPNPPAALTYQWSLDSGPASVTVDNATAPVTTAAFTAPGVYVFRLTASDSALSASSTTAVTVLQPNTAPTVNAGADQTVTATAATLSGSATDDGLPNPPGALALEWTLVDGPATVTFSSPTAAETLVTFTTYGTYDFRLRADDGELSASDVVRVVVRSGNALLPPDPSFVAPALNVSAPVSVGDATAFLYSGTDPIQVGVASATINPVYVTVLKGRVRDGAGQPLAGATVTVLNRPEFGHTLSRADGRYDLAVNGGAAFNVDARKAGYLPAQRRVEARAADFTAVDDMALVELSDSATAVAPNAGAYQVAASSPVTDARGTRRQMLVFPPNTTATMRVGNADVPLSNMTVRATEYTQGADGETRMPAALPPASAYTYAAEFSIDEAIAAGATSVTFNQPVYSYTDNFLHFPVGGRVPAGWYDAQRGVWVPSEDGRVLKVLSVTGGAADLDVDGTNTPATPAQLAALGVTAAERTEIAARFAAGATFWRVGVDHFTVWDFNWPALIPDTSYLEGDDPDLADPLVEDPTFSCGSIIDCENQKLGESLPIQGTGLNLNYHSDQVLGHLAGRTLRIPLTEALPPTAGLSEIRSQVRVAGQAIQNVVTPAPNASLDVTWNGKDAYGRYLNGTYAVGITNAYYALSNYASPADTGRSFMRMSSAPTALSGTVQVLAARQDWQKWITVWDHRAAGLGGWGFANHHTYDPNARVLRKGDGTRRRAETVASIIARLAGNGTNLGNTALPVNVPATSVALPTLTSVTPDEKGGFYFTTSPNPNLKIFHVDAVGIVRLVATTSPGASKVVVGPDGLLYFAQSTFVRKILSDGTVVVVAGNGTIGTGGDGGPATSAALNLATDITFASDGSLYIAEQNAVRRVTPDGIISLVAGRGPSPLPTTGGAALSARFDGFTGVESAPNGMVFIADYQLGRIWELTPQGDLRLAVSSGAISFASARDGVIYFAGTDRISRRGLDGAIDKIAGSSFQGAGDWTGYNGDDRNAADSQLRMSGRNTLSVDNSGAIYFCQVQSSGFNFANYIRHVSPPFPGAGFTDIVIPDESSDEVYVFDRTGRHKETRHGLTNAVLMSFTYDAAGRLSAVTDGDANVTTITRDANGNPTAITSPYGEVTQLALNADGYLATVTNPAGERVELGYNGPGGLLTSLTDPKNQTTTFAYDALGRLERDTDPAGGFKELLRTDLSNDEAQIILTTALNRTLTHRVTRGDEPGEWTRVTIAPDTTVSTTTTKLNGETETRFADGTVTAVTATPDPRFGMLSPLTQTRATTPGGRVRVTAQARTVTLAQPANKLSLTAYTDTLTLNGRAYTVAFSSPTRTFTNTSPAGRVTTTVIDAQGRVTAAQTAGLAAATFTYDGRGRLETARQGAGAGERVTGFAYNPQGRLATLTDAEARVTQFQYDLAGRVTQTTLPDLRVIGYTYDANGNLTSITPPSRPAHTMTHTAVNLEESYTPPTVAGSSFTVTQYAYNLDRQPTLVTRPDGQTISFTYDGAGRASSVTTPSGSYGYGYDANGRLSILTAPLPGGGGTGEGLAYAYDGALPLSTTWSGPVAGSVSRTFDNDFRVSAQSVNGVNTVAFGYDNDSLLTSAGAMTITRNSQNGLLTGTALGTVTDTIAHNTFGERETYTASVSGSPVFAETLTRDRLGRLTSKVQTISGVTDTYAYTYDTAGRLTAVTKNGSAWETYTYDNNGNRLSAVVPPPEGAAPTLFSQLNGAAEAGVHVAVYDAQDRLLTHGANSYTYTPNGELSSRTNNSQLTTYNYDVMGNLTSATLPSGDAVSYVFDGQDRRVGKRVNGVLVQGFLYAGRLRVVAELDAAGNVVSRFVYATRAHVPDYMVQAGVTYRIVSDHLGTPRLVINTSNGAVVQRIDTDSFGNVLADTAPGFQPFGFAGGLYDRDTELVRFGARDYAPETGRWTAKDPIRFAGGDTNLYGYVLNDPVNLVDPTGLYWFRQDWQERGVVGRPRTIVPPGGPISEFIERKVPAGYTFGQLHDAFVSSATETGIPDWLANIPTMGFIYLVALEAEMLRSVSILPQPHIWEPSCQSKK